MGTKVMDLADFAIDLCKNVWGSDLDYSLDSLKSVDDAIEQICSYDTDKKQVIKPLIALGCYVGEVIIRNFKGEWADEIDTNGLPVGLKVGNVTLQPIRKVFRKYKEGEEHNIHHYVVISVVLSESFKQ